MSINRRDLVTWAGAGLAATLPALAQPLSASASAKTATASTAPASGFNVRHFGAVGDGKNLDSKAINAAIEAAADAGGGTVYFPAGVYASYSIRLKSHITLYLDQGAVILAESTPHEGTTGEGYDAAEPQGAWEPYQDYGHNHWHNSLIWGENIHDIAILGQGLIWGKGLSRGWEKQLDLPLSGKPGVGNKAIALKNCHNVLLRDFYILQGGWFGILATGVDNLTIDNLTIDTNRDGMDIDCCNNVRVSNCTVNSPWDDGICPKSSYALGYARITENVTITNCFVTGGYQLGSVIDGTWKEHEPGQKVYKNGRIKFGTESNGGFRNITVSNCVFDKSHGFILESEDGAICEDITLTNITMRDTAGSPIFIRLGSRMRGPKDAKVGYIRRLLINNISSSGATVLPSIISGVPGYAIEDVKISDVYLHQAGGASAEMATLDPPENETQYPDPEMFGEIPATGFFLRHIKNLEMSNVEIATEAPDPRPAFWLKNVDGADFFRLRVPRNNSTGPTPVFDLRQVKDFRVFGSQFIPDFANADIETKKL
ncbi:rhamnogalacturonidase [Acidicapsa ligni]|uniref:rhamnogalacturonidase n=1 Tax=Acidicapsa ligni TaxID=542300 RepID=UPI0021E0FC25|nr:glycoside hydrolase family 28 protein [Acidicapsa ligni]